MALCKAMALELSKQDPPCVAWGFETTKGEWEVASLHAPNPMSLCLDLRLQVEFYSVRAFDSAGNMEDNEAQSLYISIILLYLVYIYRLYSSI